MPLILVVDDDAVVRNMMTKLLRKQGYEVIEAGNGIEAVEHFRQHQPAMVLLDVAMPMMNGFDACQRMRELSSGFSVSIIMLTALDDVVSVDRAFEAGATDFITKPINWSLFSQRVRYVLRARETDLSLHKNHQRIDHALTTARLGYWDWDLATGEFSMPQSALDMLGIERKQRLQLDDLLAYVPAEDRERVEYAFADARLRGTGFVLEHRLQGMDKQERYVYQHADVQMDADHKPAYVLGTIQDITALKRAEDMILHQAYHDLLTDLPNQALFKERLTHAIKVAEQTGHMVAVVMMDIDRFQLVNESLGRDIGNELLLSFAGFLRGIVSEGDTLARIGGNEFALLLESPASTEEINQLLQRIHQSLKQTEFDLAGESVMVSLGMGVALYPDDALDAAGLMQCANAAMRKAKGMGSGQQYFYTQDMNRRVDDRLRMENDLRHALENGELELFYQPQVDAQTRTIIGAEALVRWRHKTHGLVPPIRFIPLAEETGLIQPLGEYVMRCAMEQLKQWQQMGWRLKIGINLSARQFMQADLVDQVRQLIADYQIEPASIDLEITETIVMQDAENSIHKMHQLKKTGVTLSMDDFGTGYSSLSYLHQFPLDVIKIDRSFIEDIRGNPQDGAIARAVIAMAHSMNLQLIAEGVETETQFEFLKQHGCEMIQGYLISVPLNAAEFTALLQTDSNRADTE